jgi:hypothetical protein
VEGNAKTNQLKELEILHSLDVFQNQHDGRCGKLHKATFHRIIEVLSWKRLWIKWTSTSF